MDRKIIYNHPKMKWRRKQLRKNPTKAETLLWYDLKAGIEGFRFKRQYSVGPYVLDFYCPKKKLAIEIDGGYHIKESGKSYDKYRYEYIKAFGIRVLRFWNSQIETDRSEAMKLIKQYF